MTESRSTPLRSSICRFDVEPLPVCATSVIPAPSVDLHSPLAGDATNHSTRFWRKGHLFTKEKIKGVATCRDTSFLMLFQSASEQKVRNLRH
jgi:hypothetical protein